jgi:HSP20 family protein
MAYRDRKDPPGMSRRSPGNTSPWRDPYSSSTGSNWNIDPMNQLRRFSDQMDRWFDAFGVGRSGDRGEGVNVWAPEMETFLRDDQFVVRIDLPGLSKEEVNVEVTDDSVVIHGERQQVHEENRDGFYRSERNYGRFYREVALPDGAQPDTAQANYRDGVLEVRLTVPPREIHRPRRIEIGSAPTEARERERTLRTSGSGSLASQATSSTGPQGVDRPSTGGSHIPIDRNTTASRAERSVAHDKPPAALDTE